MNIGLASETLIISNTILNTRASRSTYIQPLQNTQIFCLVVSWICVKSLITVSYSILVVTDLKFFFCQSRTFPTRIQIAIPINSKEKNNVVRGRMFFL